MSHDFVNIDSLHIFLKTYEQAVKSQPSEVSGKIYDIPWSKLKTSEKEFFNLLKKDDVNLFNTYLLTQNEKNSLCQKDSDGCWIVVKGRNKRTLLEWAILLGSNKIFEDRLKQSQINWRKNSHLYLLMIHWAVEYRQAHIARTLINHPNKPSLRDLPDVLIKFSDRVWWVNQKLPLLTHPLIAEEQLDLYLMSTPSKYQKWILSYLEKDCRKLLPNISSSFSKQLFCTIIENDDDMLLGWCTKLGWNEKLSADLVNMVIRTVIDENKVDLLKKLLKSPKVVEVCKDDLINQPYKFWNYLFKIKEILESDLKKEMLKTMLEVCCLDKIRDKQGNTLLHLFFENLDFIIINKSKFLSHSMILEQKIPSLVQDLEKIAFQITQPNKEGLTPLEKIGSIKSKGLTKNQIEFIKNHVFIQTLASQLMKKNLEQTLMTPSPKPQKSRI